MNGDIDKFLNNLGNPDERKPEETVPSNAMTWDKLVTLPSTNVILGNVGVGKSGLAYHLVDSLSQKYNLQPIIANFPESKRNLLPANYQIKDSEELKDCENFIALIDEGTTTTPAGDKEAEERMKSYNSLSRQRNCIIIYIYHSSSDVGSRVLRGIYGAICLKEPSARQIRYGSKDKWMRDMLTEAKAQFQAMAKIGQNPQEWTWVDTEKPEYQGMVKNPLVSWWSDSLSKAWAGEQIKQGKDKKHGKSDNRPRGGIQLVFDPNNLVSTEDGTPITPEMRARGVKMEEVCNSKVMTDPFTNKSWVEPK